MDEPPVEAPAVAWPVLLGLAAVKIALGLVVGSGYGFFRDEFYYLACGQRPDWGYVDQPPLVPLIGRLMETIFGAANLTAGELRFPGVLASAATVVLAGLMAREMGGRRFAQGLAAFTVSIMPLFIAAGVSFGTVVFDQLLWALVLWLVLRTVRTGDGRGWLWVGLCAGDRPGNQTHHGHARPGTGGGVCIDTAGPPPSAYAVALGGRRVGAGVSVAQLAVAARAWLADAGIHP